MYTRTATEKRAVDERDVGTPVLERGAFSGTGNTSNVVSLLESQQRFDARPDDGMRDHQEHLCLRQPRYSTARLGFARSLNRSIPQASDQAVAVPSRLSGIATRLSYQTHSKVRWWETAKTRGYRHANTGPRSRRPPRDPRGHPLAPGAGRRAPRRWRGRRWRPGQPHGPGAQARPDPSRQLDAGQDRPRGRPRAQATPPRRVDRLPHARPRYP